MPSVFWDRPSAFVKKKLYNCGPCVFYEGGTFSKTMWPAAEMLHVTMPPSRFLLASALSTILILYLYLRVTFHLYKLLWMINVWEYPTIFLPQYRNQSQWVTHETAVTFICSPQQGAVSIRKTVLPGMAMPMLKIRRPNGRLIFNMEIAIRR